MTEVITQDNLTEVATTLLSKAATDYPKSYLDRIVRAFEIEDNGGSKRALASMLENIAAAAEEGRCICQDTGVPVFHVYLNPDIHVRGDMNAALTDATATATRQVPLRQNVVEPFTYENSGNNIGWGVPFVHYHYSAEPGPLKLRVELKGFGGEIKSSSDWIMTSSRNMENAVLAYVLNSVILSKGEACLPSFLGIGVGGYAAEAVANAKSAVFRELSGVRWEKTPFEERVERCVNRLGLGAGGLGGKVTTMGVYVSRRGTHTAVSSVAVSHQCWASRASEVLIGKEGVRYVTPHLEKGEAASLREKVVTPSLGEVSVGARVHEFTTPVSDPDIARLRIGDIVYLNGTICTARDRAHQRMVSNLEKGDDIPQEILDSKAIYHCGPVVAEESCGWTINAAGPTTSSRFTDDGAVLAERGVFNMAIGKGTMGERMRLALKGRGVYLLATGGCAIVYQKRIRTASPRWLDLGYPEAVWVFDVDRFGPLVVGIDSTGQSLSTNLMDQVYEKARDIYRDEGLDPHERYAQYPVTFAGLALEEIIAREHGTMQA